jgi:subtilisin family serine protease
MRKHRVVRGVWKHRALPGSRRHRVVAGTVAGVAALALAAIGLTLPASAGDQGTTEYTVLAKAGVSDSTAVAAIEAAGGQVLTRNTDVGMYQVEASDTFAASVADSSVLVGAAPRRPIGKAPDARPLADVEREGIASATAAATTTDGVKAGMDPLDKNLWGLQMVHADTARTVTPGSHQVTVGILDTGVDASHPDIAPNFNWALSRNFAKDMPDIDGPCEVSNCMDPVGTDDGGHGTHVAGTIGAAVNDFGVSGVAPGVSLVELKGGQDSGYFFLEAAVNALTYAGDSGIDVVNMSFYLDPWLYNCSANPADSPEAQEEQRTIIAAMNRALTYAHDHGVTLVAALGNNHEDLGHPRTDFSSPDYPAGAAYERPVDNADCVDLPVEGPSVIGVSALGPSTSKSDYSNYGVEQISVSAPGGWFRDGYGTRSYRTVDNEILSTYPENVLRAEGLVDRNGHITTAGKGSVVKRCDDEGRCGFYTWLQGTSMASPHATGVAALIVSRYGTADPAHPGTVTMSPDAVEKVLTGTAAAHACPDPATVSYVREGRSAEFDATCEGDSQFNGFYGYGIVDAYAAVTNG